MRLAFDFTLDETVDTNLRAMKRSKSVQAIRSKEIWITTVVSTIAVFVSWNVSSGGFKSPGSHIESLAIAEPDAEITSSNSTDNRQLLTLNYDFRLLFHQASRFVISFSNPKSVGL